MFKPRNLFDNNDQQLQQQEVEDVEEQEQQNHQEHEDQREIKQNAREPQQNGQNERGEQPTREQTLENQVNELLQQLQKLQSQPNQQQQLEQQQHQQPQQKLAKQPKHQQQWREQKPRQQYNILLFGETGSGKSTLINYLTNYFHDGSLKNLKIAIPTKHHQATEGLKFSEKDLHDTTKSKTSECTEYSFTKDNARYNFIDTPGLSDTEGTTKDDEHIMMIMAAAEGRGTLSAIVIVINGTVARATSNLRNTLTLLKGSVPDVLLKNLLIILTNCSKGTANFDLKQFDSWNVPGDNVFYMNNSALSTPVQCWKDEEIMEDLKHYWKKSMKTIDKIVEKVEKLGNKVTSAFRDMRLKRNKIKSELHGILLEVKKLQKMQDELNCAQSAQQDVTSDIQKYSNYKQTKQVDYVEMEETTYHSTICGKHTQICHEGCGLTFTSAQGDEIFKGCACMSGTHCRECECDHSTHYHDKKKPVKKTKTVEDILHDVKALYDQHTGKKAQLQSKISSLSSDIDSLKRALDAKEAGIRKCCEELKTLCSHFNFVDELESIIDTMERDARSLTNMQARKDAESRINNIVHIANQLSVSK